MNLEWFYVYWLIPFHFQVAQWAPLGTGPTYFPLFFFHCNFGTLVGFPLSRMLAGWLVLAPLFLRWDYMQWRHQAAAATAATNDSGVVAFLSGGALSAAAAQRVAGLLLGSLTSMLLVQLAFGPALCKGAMGVSDRDDASPARKPTGDVSDQRAPAACKPPNDGASSPSSGRSSGQQQGQRARAGISSARRLTGRWPRALNQRLASLWAAAEAFDRRFYTYGNVMLRAVPLGVMVLVACLPYALYMFVLSCWRIGVYGDAAPEASFRPGDVMLCLLAAFLLGRTDLQDLLRRLSQTEEVLCDLVPQHVAAALMSASKQQQERQQQQKRKQQQQQQAKPASASGDFTPPLQQHAPERRASSGGCAGALSPQQRSRRQTAVNGLSSGTACEDDGSGGGGGVSGQLEVLLPSALLSGLGSGAGGEEDPAVGLNIAEWHEGVTILFADIRGFTEMSQQVEPYVVMNFLNRLYHRFDQLACSMPGIYKVETIGDCYMVASGLLRPDDSHATTMLRFAEAMRRAALEVTLPHTGEPVQIRIGVHSGRVMSGVVGSIRKRYCLFGDTVNTASRMESHGQPGRIHVSSATRDVILLGSAASEVESEFEFEARQPIDVKGKGRMQTYFANPSATQM